jgi:hypothetical protein
LFGIGYYGYSGPEFTCAELAPKMTKRWGRKKWCIHHMGDSKLSDIIEESMDDKFQEETDKIMLKQAKVEAGKEMKLAFGMGYSPLFLPTIYSDVDERSRNTAFRTLFLKKHIDIYEKARSTAIDKWQSPQSSKDKRELSDFLVKELESSGVHISEKISEIFKNDFVDALEKHFSFFKERLPCDMRSENTKKKEWALKKLTNIKVFEQDFLNKDKEDLILDAKIQVEKIYEKYEEEITDAYENYDVPFMNFFCFTDVVDLYPDFKSNTEDDPLFKGLTDDYAVWYEKTWREIEIRKEKCACHTCTKNLHLTAECARVIRQRAQKVPFRTCPFCQKNIPYEHFDEKGEHGHIKFVSSSEVTCDKCREFIESDIKLCKECKDYHIATLKTPLLLLQCYRCSHKKS